jgi:hypothetical protein
MLSQSNKQTFLFSSFITTPRIWINMTNQIIILFTPNCEDIALIVCHVQIPHIQLKILSNALVLLSRHNSDAFSKHNSLVANAPSNS